MKINLKILEKTPEIENRILTALLPDCTRYMDTAVLQVQSKLPSIVSTAIINMPEYISLTSGELKFEFGIPDAGAKIAELINTWMNNIEFTYKKPYIVSRQIRSIFSAGLIKIDFSDVLYSNFAFVQDASGYSLPWLQWLLLDGSAVLVANHTVIIGPNSRSRTGNAVMRQSQGRGWSVPSRYQGTINDNWITRAIDSVAPEIENLIEGAMQI